MVTTGRRIARNCQFLITAVMSLAALFTTGCDECESGQTRCQGDVAGQCVDDGIRNHWSEWSCPVKCHATPDRADCVHSREPVPECMYGLEDVCFEGAPAYCWDGYAIKGPPCRSGTQCVNSVACGPVCVMGDSPEPRCAQYFFCDGSDALVSCNCGFAAYRYPCNAGDSCREVRGVSSCLPPTPDPRCGDPTREAFGFCDGTVSYSCWFGYLSSSDCATTSSPPGRCEMVTTPSPQSVCVSP